MRLRYTDRAKDDLDLAFLWYEKQRRGLGFEFLDCVEAALQYIIDCPEMYGIRYYHYRGCNIRRFPFSIYYSIEKDEIIVHSIFDNRQDPEKKP